MLIMNVSLYVFTCVCLFMLLKVFVIFGYFLKERVSKHREEGIAKESRNVLYVPLV